MLWLLVFTARKLLEQSLGRELCGLAWLVGIFLVEFTEVERHAPNVDNTILGLGLGLRKKQKVNWTLASIYAFILCSWQWASFAGSVSCYLRSLLQWPASSTCELKKPFGPAVAFVMVLCLFVCHSNRNAQEFQWPVQWLCFGGFPPITHGIFLHPDTFMVFARAAWPHPNLLQMTFLPRPSPSVM